MLLEWTTNQKGAIAETAVAHAAVRAGMVVLRPIVEARYDLAFDVGGRLLRVQCKWAREVGEVVIVNCRTARRGPNGFIHGGYTAEEIDAVAAFCLTLDRCFFVPAARLEGRKYFQLRLTRSKTTKFAA